MDTYQVTPGSPKTFELNKKKQVADSTQNSLYPNDRGCEKSRVRYTKAMDVANAVASTDPAVLQ